MKYNTNKLSIANMVVIIFAFCVLLPVLVTSMLFIENLRRNSIEQREEMLSQLNEQITNALDMISEEIQGLGSMHSAKWDILSILRRNYAAHDADYVKDCRLMSDMMGVCMQTNAKIYRMAFISRSGEVFTQFSPPYIDDIRLIDSRIQTMNELGQDIIVFPPVEIVPESDESAYIPYILKLKDPHTWVTVGYLAVDLRYSAIKKLFENGDVDCDASAHVMILYGDNIIYSSFAAEAEDDVFVQSVREFLSEGRVTGSINIANGSALDGSYTISTWHHAGTGWDVVTYSSDYVVTDAIFHYMLSYALAIAVIILITAITYRTLFKRFMDSVRTLKNAMLNARCGQIDQLTVDNVNTSEITMLFESYNAMAERILESIQREYELQLLQKKTEMDMLLSQINPHFLYNTLSLMRAVIQSNDNERAEQIVMCLSAMLRYSSRRETFVTLREELEQICNYLTIQSLRFRDTVHTEIDIDIGLYDCMIIKFILQPIVENAFKHGLELIKNNRKLAITALSNDDKIAITIRDNGVGIAADKLHALQEALNSVSHERESKSAQTPHAGIGLLNVHKRLYYTYGAPYGLTLDSEPGKWTEVTVLMPWREREGDGDEDTGG